MTSIHTYQGELLWEGYRGLEPISYENYSRNYRFRAPGKHEIVGSADSTFLGDPELYNPEDLFIASIGACHMLFFLALAAKRGICVVSYRDQMEGILNSSQHRATFEQLTLTPQVCITQQSDIPVAVALHQTAHNHCFLSRSCSFPITIVPQVSVHHGDRPQPKSDADLRDLTLRLPHEPGSLAKVGKALGEAGVALEGGGAWLTPDTSSGCAHFLVNDAKVAVRALNDVGITVSAVQPVILHRLAQGRPGQLGRLTTALGQAEINIEIIYSNHDHQLVLVVDKPIQAIDIIKAL